MAPLRAVDLATVDILITAGIVNSRAEGLRWALSRLREHPAYAQLWQQAHENDEPKTGAGNNRAVSAAMVSSFLNAAGRLAGDDP